MPVAVPAFRRSLALAALLCVAVPSGPGSPVSLSSGARASDTGAREAPLPGAAVVQAATPLPPANPARPGPARTMPHGTCADIVATWRVAGVVEERGYGAVAYLAGAELGPWLAAFNALPPETAFAADAAIVIAPDRPVLLAPGAPVSPGARDIRFFRNGCLVIRSVLPERAWSRLAREAARLWGVPA